MFRAKLIATFFVLICVLTGGTYFILHGQVQSSFDQDADASLRRSATVAQQAMRLDEFALIEKARFTAQSEELYSKMRISESPQLYERLAQDYPEANTVQGIRHVAVYDAPLKKDELLLQSAAKSAAAKSNVDRDLYARSPAVPDLFMVLDPNGKAVAALGKGRKRWWRHNIAERFPVVLNAVRDNQVKTAIWSWAWNESDTPDLYRVAIVPIRPTPGQAAAGVVITGMTLHDGLATQSQRLLAGSPSASGAEATAADLKKAPQFAFFKGDQIVASTFSSARETDLTKAAFTDQDILESDAPDTFRTLDVGGQSYRAMSRFFSDQFGVADAPAGFIVLSPSAGAQKPVSLATTNIIALAGAVLLVGIILMLFFVQSFIKPLSTIEQGLGEVLAGNKDYVYDVDAKNDTYLSIFQGLNLVFAYLQGKPMPDDPNAHGDWGELLADNDANANAAPGKVTGVAMPGMGKKRKPTSPEKPSNISQDPSE